MRYSVFHHIIESNIPLPELQIRDNSLPTLFFESSNNSKATRTGIDWRHHWRLSNGKISISVGKEKEYYWLRFPQLVDFKIAPETNKIKSYCNTGMPDNTLRHLLLDQTIPRLLSHKGQLIIHASCVQIGDSLVGFCGESGWGKSTLAAYLYGQGHTLITDDCLLLETNNSTMVGIPSY